MPTCGRIAFRYTEMPKRGEAIDAQKARLLDGTTPVNGTYIICGSCGEEAWIGDLAPAEWLAG